MCIIHLLFCERIYPCVYVCVYTINYPWRQSYILVHIGLKWTATKNNYIFFTYCYCKLHYIWNSLYIIPRPCLSPLFTYVLYSFWVYVICINCTCWPLEPHMILSFMLNRWYHFPLRWMFYLWLCSVIFIFPWHAGDS